MELCTNLSAAEEHDAGHSGGHAALEHADGGRGALLGGGLLGARLAGRHHVRLEQRALEVHVVHHQRVVHEREHLHAHTSQHSSRGSLYSRYFVVNVVVGQDES